MPTIDQLAPATAASDTDELLASQSGVARKVTRAQIVSGLQPMLTVPSGKLVGRSSAGVGGPEPISIGANLTLSGGILSAAATPFTIAGLPTGTPPGATDLVPLAQGGGNVVTSVAQLTAGMQPVISQPTGTLLGRASTGVGAPETITLGANLSLSGHTLSASGFTIAALPAGVAPSASDLVPLAQGGVNVATSYAQFTSSLQTKLTLGSGALLGRSSSGNGGPEAVSVGAGLTLTSGKLAAVGFSIPALPVGSAPGSTDLVPIGQNGGNVVTSYAQFTAPLQAKISLPSGSLLGRASSGTGAPETLTVGSNLSLSGGVLSAPAPFTIRTLSTGSVPAATDLVPLSQGGSNVSVTYANFMSGLFALPNVNVSTTLVTPTHGGVARTIADATSDIFDVRNFGAKGDGVTDDTSAIQAAINAAQAANINGFAPARVYIPGGTYLHHGLTATYPVEIAGDGPRTSVLRLASGSAVPNLLLTPTALAGHNYYNGGAPPGTFTIRNLMLQGAGSDPAGATKAHGLAIWQPPVNAVYSRVLVDDVMISSASADGLNSADNPNGAWQGFLCAHHLYIVGSQRTNFNTNSVFDWRITDSDFSVCGQDNLVLSGSAGFVVTGTNIYGAGRWNLVVYQAAGVPYAGHNTFIGCDIDTAQQGGLRFDVSSAECPSKFSACNFGGQTDPTKLQNAGVYSDIYVNSLYATGDLLLDNCTFLRPYAIDPKYYAKFNVEYAPGVATSVVMSNCRISWPLANAISNPNQVVGLLTPGGTVVPTNVLNGSLQIVTGSAPNIVITDPTVPANWRSWVLEANSETLAGAAVNDDGSANSGSNWLNVQRSAAQITAVNFGGPSVFGLQVALPAAYANGLQVTASIAGEAPILAPVGADTAIGVIWATKGNAAHVISAPLTIGGGPGQVTRVVLQAQTSASATPVQLTFDRNSPTAGNSLIIPDLTGYRVSAVVFGYNLYSGAYASFTVSDALIHRVGSALYLNGVTSFTLGNHSSNAADWTATLAVDTLHMALAVQVATDAQGGANWMAEITLMCAG
jgi:hypothetical protein